jgi:hypothetical protein
MKMTTRSLFNGVAVGSVATLAFAFGAVDRAQAATISLSNTGVDNAYTVNNGGSIAITNNSNWVQGSTSSWIGSQTAAPGQYTYSTNFSLANLLAGTAQISGNWAVDNSTLATGGILLNGLSTGITYNPATSFGGFTAFNISNSANFQEGNNTLAFTIVNGANPDPTPNNPAGLNVAMTGTYSEATTAVPEPSDFVGTVFALGSVVALKRKFGKK